MIVDNNNNNSLLIDPMFSDNITNATADDDCYSSIDSVSLSPLRPSYPSPSSINNVI